MARSNNNNRSTRRMDANQEKRASNRKPFGAPSRGAAENQEERKSEGWGSKETRSPKVARAKKMPMRHGNQKQQDKANALRVRRTDLESIESVRLQKALAASGVGSRREMEEWITQGFVTVNGKVAELGEKVSPTDRVIVKGNNIKLKWPDRLPRIIIYNKQEGEIVSRNDPKGRVSVFDRVAPAKSSRWVAIGRLDVNTTGMLIITTSGELANRFSHPSFEVEREYSVRILGTLTDEQTKQLMTEGVTLEDGVAKFQFIHSIGGEGVNQWYKVVIKEGRNREVRRVFEHLGFTVSRLMRTRFGPVSLPSRLKRGQFYELNEIEVSDVMKWANMILPGTRRQYSK